MEVVTGDRDLFQLVRSTPTPTSVIYVGKGWAKAEILGEAEVSHRYGVPIQRAGRGYAEMSMLRGDPSDGLPGVSGIGEKTAAKLITEFGSLAALIDAAAAGDRRVTPKNRERLTQAADYLAVAPTVVTVAPDAAVVLSTSDDHVPAGAFDEAALLALGEQWNIGASVGRLVSALGAYRGN